MIVAVKKLVGVTKKLATGGMHTKFHSSSSSNSSSSDSSSSDPSSDNQTVEAHRKQGSGQSKTQWDIKKVLSRAKALGVTGNLKAMPVVAKKITPCKKGATPFSEKKGVTCNGVRGTKEAIAIAARSKRRKKGKGLKVNGKIPAVVGGARDVLTTSSRIYTSPVGKVANVKVTDAAAAALGRRDGDKGIEEVEEDHIEGADVGMDAQGGGEEEDMSTGGTCAGEGGGVKAVECGVRDYSSFPALQGVPRTGDRLAFKVCAYVLMDVMMLYFSSGVCVCVHILDSRALRKLHTRTV